MLDCGRCAPKRSIGDRVAVSADVFRDGHDALGAAVRYKRPAGDRHGKVSSQTLEVDVDRVVARFGAWYELFPRSWGGFRGVAEILPRLAELGFDVVYLPPIHSIGETNRKGRNNAPVAEPGD